jgi:hypothetical protein
MKKYIILFLLFLSILSLSAQTASDSLDSYRNRQIRKAVMIELYTIDGQKHTGYLMEADSQTIVLSNKVIAIDSVSVFSTTGIFQMKATIQVPFGNRFLHMMVFSASALSIVTIAGFSNSEDVMVGPLFVIGAGTAIFGTPFSLLSALVLNKERVVFDYRVDGVEKEFSVVTQYLEKKSLKLIPDSTVYLKLNPQRNDAELSHIEIPYESCYPLEGKKVHFTIGTSVSAINLSAQLMNNMNSLDYSSDIYTNHEGLGIIAQVQFNVNKNFRPYLGLISKETGYGSCLLSDVDEDRLDLKYTATYLFLGTDYVFKPVNNLMLSRVEWTVGGGLSYTALKYENSIKSLVYPLVYHSQKKSMVGFRLNGSFDYYVTPNFSIYGLLSTELMPDINLDNYQFKKTDQQTITVEGGSFNTSNLHFSLGMKIHL